MGEDTAKSGLMPVPVSATVCGEPEALSVTLTEAEKLAADAGEKVSDSVQLAPAVSVVLQPLVRVNVEASAPVSEMLVMLSEAVPGFERVTVLAELVVLTT